MVNTFAANRCWLLAAATSTCVAGLLTVTVPAQADPACASYEFPPGTEVHLIQSDKWTVVIPASGTQLNGKAKGDGPIRGGAFSGTAEVRATRTEGSPTGGIVDGTKIDFTIDWDNGHRSHYYGSVKGDGRATGERDDVRSVGAGPDNTTWHTAAPLTCIAAAAPPALPAPAKAAEPDPAVPQPVKPTATVTAGTDVYDAPDGDGKEVGVFLTVGRQLQIVDPGCRDDWCHLAVAEAPGGIGWVYQPHLQMAG
jgi:hypothetical protein